MPGVRQIDIAERLGISQQAVAYALSERPDYRRKLNHETRRRILKTARQLGYVPRQAARSLRCGRTDAVLVTTRASLGQAHIHEFVEALNIALNGHGKEMLLELSARADQPDRVLRTLAGGIADAVVVLGYEPEWLKALLDGLPAGFPRVMIGPGEPAGISSVEYDRVLATELAVSHLLDQGHRQVALVFDIIDDLPADERVRGYLAALAKARLTPDETLLFRASAQEPDGVALWKRLRARQPRPTAVYCYNDELTLALLHAIRLDGLRVPQDMALVTTGNTRFTRLGDVAISTVDIDYGQIARVAMDLLLGQMNTPGDPVRHARVQPRLVARASSMGRPEREEESATKGET